MSYWDWLPSELQDKIFKYALYLQMLDGRRDYYLACKDKWEREIRDYEAFNRRFPVKPSMSYEYRYHIGQRTKEHRSQEQIFMHACSSFLHVWADVETFTFGSLK